MLTIACVLKVGGGFLPEHVAALRDGVERNLSLPHRFLCLSDVPVPCERIPLPFGWPGWWNKLILFKPGVLEGPVLYFDLDTIIVGSLDDIALGHRFTVLRNFWASAYGEPERIGSGMMAWNCDLSAIYEAFARNPERFMREYRTKAKWGDQGFIKDHSLIEPDRWQDKHPSKVVSYKKHVRPLRKVPREAAVICFHGIPRPWSSEVKWLREKVAA